MPPTFGDLLRAHALAGTRPAIVPTVDARGRVMFDIDAPGGGEPVRYRVDRWGAVVRSEAEATDDGKDWPR